MYPCFMHKFFTNIKLLYSPKYIKAIKKDQILIMVLNVFLLVNGQMNFKLKYFKLKHIK